MTTAIKTYRAILIDPFARSVTWARLSNPDTITQIQELLSCEHTRCEWTEGYSFQGRDRIYVDMTEGYRALPSLRIATPGRKVQNLFGRSVIIGTGEHGRLADVSVTPADVEALITWNDDEATLVPEVAGIAVAEITEEQLAALLGRYGRGAR